MRVLDCVRDCLPKFRRRNLIGVEEQNPFALQIAIFERPVSLLRERFKGMFVNARAGLPSYFLSAIIAAGIDYHCFPEAGDGFQTTRQIVGLVLRENDDGE